MGGELVGSDGSIPKTESRFENREQQLQFLLNRYREFHESAPVGYFAIDADNSILDVNISGARLLGATREKLLGMRFTAFIVARNESCFSSFMNHILEKDEWQECELEMVNTGGSIFQAALLGRQLIRAKEHVIFVSDSTKRKQAEYAKEGEKKYREVADLLSEGIYESDSSGFLSYANLKLRNSLGIDENDFKNRIPVFEFIDARDKNLAIERFTRIIKGEDLGPQEYLMRRRDGTTFPALIHSLAVLREGVLIGIRGVVFDISERQHAEIALRESERRYRELADLCGAGIFEADITGTITYANRKGLSSFGLDENDLKSGLNVFDLVLPRDLNVAMENFSRVVKQEDVGPSEYSVRRKDGTTFPVLTHSSPILREGVVVGIRGIVVDISELKRTEQALKESERKYRELTDLLDEGVFETDINGTVTYINRKGLSYFGLGGDDLKNGLRVFDVIVPTDSDLPRERFSKVVKNEDIGAAEYLLKRKDGTTFPALTRSSAILQEGVVVGVRGVVVDISELKRTEQALKDSERKYRELTDLLDEGVFETGPDGTITYANRRGLSYLGLLDDDLKKGFNVLDIIAPQDWNLAGERITRVFKQEDIGAVEYTMKRRDGTTFPALIHSSAVVRRGRVVGVRGILIDISERKHIEEELKNSQRRLADIIESLPDAVMVIDVEGKTTSWNRAMEALTGVKAADILGKGNYEYAIPFYGERRPILIDLVMKPVEEVIAKYAHVRWHGNTLTGEAHITNLPGGEKFFWGHAAALQDLSGKVVGAIETIRDVTERKRFEDELAGAKDAAESATHAKSAFLATMSHEIRTPMNAIIGMTSLLLDTELTPAQQDYATTIRASGDALLSTINDILDFSKIEAGRIELELQPFDLRECVEGAVSLLTVRAVDKGLELACLIESDIPTIIVSDENRLRQILLNLLSNGVKFTASGEVSLTVTAQKMPDDSLFELHFAVRDTGIGIPAERMSRLFQSFSQADSSISRNYGGTGLGLVISKRLSELMGGTMWVESEGVPGRGSTFHFTIRAPQSEKPSRSLMQHAHADLRDKRVLIVDDNETNQHIMALQTEAWGMQPVVATTAFAALEHLKGGEIFDVALIDYQMPDMDGVSLIREIRKLRDAKGLPAILVSSIGRDRPTGEEFSWFLMKPVRASRLYDALIGILSSEGAPPAHQQFPPKATEFDSTMGKRLPLRILLAEDNVANQKVILWTLLRLGYRADVAANGLEVLAALERQPYDVILMDMQMPEMDGLEATRRVRTQWRERGPRIIAMTANVTKEDRQACLEAGMNDYLAKPIRVHELMFALSKNRPSVAPANHTPAPPVTEPPLVAEALEPAAIQELLNLVGRDKSSLADLIDSFLEETPKLMAELRLALETENLDLLRRAGHTLKSSSRDFGVLALSGLGKQIEKLGQERSWAGVAELVKQAEVAYDRAKAALEKIRSGA